MSHLFPAVSVAKTLDEQVRAAPSVIFNEESGGGGRVVAAYPPPSAAADAVAVCQVVDETGLPDDP
jgi:hypothetical protein